MSITTLSTFVDFALVGSPSNLEIIGVTFENWPAANSCGYLMSVVEQTGPGISGSSAWLSATSGDRGDAYLPHVSPPGGVPAVYGSITTAQIGTTLYVFGVTYSGSLFVAATRSQAGHWQAGQVLPGNSFVLNSGRTSTYVVIPSSNGSAQIVALDQNGVPSVVNVYNNGTWSEGPANGTTGGLPIDSTDSPYVSITAATVPGGAYLFGSAPPASSPYTVRNRGHGPRAAPTTRRTAARTVFSRTSPPAVGPSCSASSPRSGTPPLTRFICWA
jgi:hypothetical protein